MTLYVIPDLVFLNDGSRQVANSPLGVIWIEADNSGKQYRFMCGPWLPIELAQSAANDWYKAKMAEGLKVATVEELKQAID